MAAQPEGHDMNENEQNGNIGCNLDNDESRRAYALDMALRTAPSLGRDQHDVLAAAKAYEAYLRGGAD